MGAPNRSDAGAGPPPARTRRPWWLLYVAAVVFWLSLAAMGVGLAAGQAKPGIRAMPEPWRLWVAAALTLAVTGMLVHRALVRRVVAEPAPTWWLVSIGVAAVAACGLAPVQEVGVLAVVAVVVVALNREVGPAWLLLVPPALGYAYVTWCINGDTLSPVASLVLVAAIVGVIDAVRRRREVRDLETAQAVVLARTRARAEAAEERARLAARVHDVLGHSLAGVAVSLQAARAQARAEGATPDLQHRLEAAHLLAREGMAGARDAVEALRGGDPDRDAEPPNPTQDDLGVLIRRLSAATGLEVTVTGRLDALVPEYRSTALDVVREALTNSIRHAPGRPVQVGVTAEGVQVVTVDVAAPIPERSADDLVSGHHGLDGLGARVRAKGGTFAAGRRPEGWVVAAYWAG